MLHPSVIGTALFWRNEIVLRPRPHIRIAGFSENKKIIEGLFTAAILLFYRIGMNAEILFEITKT